MKKIFILTLLFIVGTFTFAMSNSAKVTVKATIVSEELVVGGKNDKPLILDFGKNSKDGKLDFTLKYSGVENVDSSSKVILDINTPNVQLINENNGATLGSNVVIDKKVQNLLSNSAEINSSIYGKLNNLNSKTANGLYTGIVELNITVIPM